MPTGPNGERRPVSVIAGAVKVCRIATGEETEVLSAGQKLGQRGGEARAQNLSPERRSEIARLAAQTRWQGGEKPKAVKFVAPRLPTKVSSSNATLARLREERAALLVERDRIDTLIAGIDEVIKAMRAK